MPKTFARLTIACLTLLAIATPVLADSLPDYTPDANATRSEVPDAYKWSLDALYASPDAWEAEIVTLRKRLPELVAFKGKLANPADLVGLASVIRSRGQEEVLAETLERGALLCRPIGHDRGRLGDQPPTHAGNRGLHDSRLLSRDRGQVIAQLVRVLELDLGDAGDGG